MTIVGMIPARIGSVRCKTKNLALIAGKPVLAYGIEAALKSQAYDKVVVNGDHVKFKEIASSYGVEYYSRPAIHASSSTKSDDVVADFLSHYRTDFLVWHNSIAPWQLSDDVKAFVTHLRTEAVDSLFSTYDTQLQACCNSEPINFSIDGKFMQTQDLKPIQLFAPFLMGWRTEVFLKSYKSKGHGFMSGTIGYHPVSKQSSLVIKTEEDLRMIRSIMENNSSFSRPILYFS